MYPLRCYAQPSHLVVLGDVKYASLIPLNKAINEIGAGTMDILIKRASIRKCWPGNAIVKDAFERFFPNMPGGN